MKAGPSARFAQTSGSTGKPKEHPLHKTTTARAEVYIQRHVCESLLCIQASNALLSTSSIHFNQTHPSRRYCWTTTPLPNYLSTLQAPYRVQHSPAIHALVSKYGAAAVRLWILTISNPGVLYATNPSTISTFLDELASDWQQASRLVKDWCEAPASFTPEVHKIARRLESRGCNERLKQIASATHLFPCQSALLQSRHTFAGPAAT